MIIKERKGEGTSQDGKPYSYELMTVSIKVDDFIEEIKKIAKDGWANIVIKKRREPSEKGVTHYVIKDEYTPKKSYQDAKPNTEGADISVDDIPF